MKNNRELFSVAIGSVVKLPLERKLFQVDEHYGDFTRLREFCDLVTLSDIDPVFLVVPNHVLVRIVEGF